MVSTIGCSFVLAIIGFVIGFGCSLALTTAAFQDHLMYGTMVGGVTFLAAIILAANDRREFARAKRFLKKSIASRAPVSDAEFVAHFPHHDEEMLLHVRKALGKFYAVDALKIHPTDRLAADLRFHDLEPSLHMSLAATLFADLPNPVH